MKNKILLLLLLISAPVFSQSISQHAENLKNQIQELKEINAQKELIIQDQTLTIEELEKKEAEYDAAMKSRIEEIDKLSQEMFKQEIKIKSLNKKLTIAVIIFVIMFLIKAVIMFLKWKYGIKLPYIINCIL